MEIVGNIDVLERWQKNWFWFTSRQPQHNHLIVIMTSEMPLPYKLANLGNLRLRGILYLVQRIKQKVVSIRDQVAKVMCEAINKFEIQGAFWLFLLIFSTKMKNLLQLLFKKSFSRRPDLAGLYNTPCITRPTNKSDCQHRRRWPELGWVEKTITGRKRPFPR